MKSRNCVIIIIGGFGEKLSVFQFQGSLHSVIFGIRFPKLWVFFLWEHDIPEKATSDNNE